MRKRASQSRACDARVVIEAWTRASQASRSSNQQQEEKELEKATAAKRDVAALRQKSINFGYFFNHRSLLGRANRRGWVA